MGMFVALIYGDETVWDEWTDAEATANGEAHRVFNENHGSHVRGGHELERSRIGRVVRLGPNGAQVVSPAPFVPAQHVLGGFYVLEAADLDEAVELARQLPEASAATSGVEVRPVAAG
jgi:hypothetical protein